MALLEATFVVDFVVVFVDIVVVVVNVVVVTDHFVYSCGQLKLK